MKKASTATFWAGIADPVPPSSMVAPATYRVPGGGVTEFVDDSVSLGALAVVVPPVSAGLIPAWIDSANTLGRWLLAVAGLFPKRYQALKPKVTAETAHTVRAIRKGTKRELRREIV